jgi:hypothetical protein
MWGYLWGLRKGQAKWKGEAFFVTKKALPFLSASSCE